jgi:hypothetical protein
MTSSPTPISRTSSSAWRQAIRWLSSINSCRGTGAPQPRQRPSECNHATLTCQRSMSFRLRLRFISLACRFDDRSVSGGWIILRLAKGAGIELAICAIEADQIGTGRRHQTGLRHGLPGIESKSQQARHNANHSGNALRAERRSELPAHISRRAVSTPTRTLRNRRWKIRESRSICLSFYASLT